jgi:hypothetical protein
MPMPLILEVDESNLGWRSVSDVVVVETFSGELASAGSFGHAGIGAEAPGRVGALADLGDGVAQAGGHSVRGKNPPAQ